MLSLPQYFGTGVISISSNGAVKPQIADSRIKAELFFGFFEADASLQTKHNEKVIIEI